MKDVVKTGRGGLIVNNLGVFPGNVKWFGNQVWDVLSNQHIQIEVKGVNLFSKVCKTW